MVTTRTRALVGTLLALWLLLAALFVSYWATTRPVSSVACVSDDPCVANASVGNTCVTPPRLLQNGSDCTARDVCYRTVTGVRKRCVDGQCVSRQQDCMGYCQDDSDCTALPLWSDAFGTNVTSQRLCYAQSCVTVVVGGHTPQCQQWLSDPRVSRCLYMSYSDAWGEFEPGVCVYRYLCAPFDFYDPSPTAEPTAGPTVAPTVSPTAAPTALPTAAPTAVPTAAPTKAPTVAPTAPTKAPTVAPTDEPTEEPTAEPPGGLRLSGLEFGSGSPAQIRDLRDRIALMLYR
jgi:cell division septation protein DedD